MRGVAVTDSASLEITALLGALNPSARTSVDCDAYAPKSPLSHWKRALEIPRSRAETAAKVDSSGASCEVRNAVDPDARAREPSARCWPVAQSRAKPTLPSPIRSATSSAANYWSCVTTSSRAGRSRS